MNIQRLKFTRAAFLFVLTLSLAGCGGGGGSSSSSTPPTAVTSSSSESTSVAATSSSSGTSSSREAIRGRFSDIPVAGLSYKTEHRSGVTDQNGYFYYDRQGEEIQFQIGSLDIGRALTAQEVTIFDLSSTTDEIASGKAGRVAQIFQSLDTHTSAGTITLPSDINVKFNGTYIPSFTGSQSSFEGAFNDKLAEWGTAQKSIVPYSEALTNAQKFAETIASTCALPDPYDNGTQLTGLSCSDKAKYNYYISRIAPYLSRAEDEAQSRIQDISVAWSESAAQDAIDINPVLSALQVADAVTEGLDAKAKEKTLSMYASLGTTFLKSAQTVTDLIVTFNPTVSSNKEEAIKLSKSFDLTQKVMETIVSAASCKAFMEQKKDSDANDCVKTLSGIAATAEKAYGSGVFKANTDADKTMIKAALKVVADSMSVVSATLKLTGAVEGGGAKLHRAAFGLGAAILKVSRDSVTLAYASNGDKVPNTGWRGFLVGVVDNVATPILAVGTNCAGVASSGEPTQYWKCLSSQTQEIGKVAIKASFAVIGTVEAVRNVGVLNETIVAKQVIYELLKAGSTNQLSVYRKYNVDYNGDDSTWRWVSPLNILINRIGEKEFRLSGIADYSDWISLAWNATVRQQTSYSIDEARKLVLMNMERINNETSFDFSSTSLKIKSTISPVGNNVIEIAVNPSDYGFTIGSLICTADDSTNYSTATPWKGVVSGNTTLNFTPLFKSSGNKGIFCVFYSGEGIFKGAINLAVISTDASSLSSSSSSSSSSTQSQSSSSIAPQAKSGTFIVNANASAGTVFSVPKDTSTCNFTATTSQWGLAASGQDTTLEGNTAWVSSTYGGHPIVGGALIAKPITGAAIKIGASKTLNSLTPDTQWTFMANDSPAGYADNIGSATVSYDCSSVSGAIDIPATAFVRGVNVALSSDGSGADTLMNAPPYGPANNAAEWDINIPSTGRYELFAIYAAVESRAVAISFNGNTVFTSSLSATTGGWLPEHRQTISQGFVQLSAGANIMRVSRAGVFPHIKGFSLVPAPLAEAIPEFVPIPGKNFSMSKYETTFAEYDAYAEETGAAKPDDAGWGRGNRPVINVSWNDAVAYAAWLSKKTGKNYRLPTNEEWEFSARANTATSYPWGNTASHAYANYGSDACCTGVATNADLWLNTAPVGQFPANGFGLYDMHGNTWEWTQDCHPNGCTLRGMRGGSWLHTPDHMASAFLNWGVPTGLTDQLGFRLVQENQ